MNTIYKYTLAVTDVQRVRMPHGARLLSVGIQNDTHLCLWAHVEDSSHKVDRVIAVVGTGNPAPELDDGTEYVGTVISPPFVWHIFDGGESSDPLQ